MKEYYEPEKISEEKVNTIINLFIDILRIEEKSNTKTEKQKKGKLNKIFSKIRK